MPAARRAAARVGAGDGRLGRGTAGRQSKQSSSFSQVATSPRPPARRQRPARPAAAAVEKGDREDEHFHSPEVQIEAARRWARDRGERLVASPIPEIDVSGRLPLSKRPGLLAAIEMIEAGRADQLLVAYFDRLVRSLKVQLEVIERVEGAGGEIFALDHGKLTNGTAAQRLFPAPAPSTTKRRAPRQTSPLRARTRQRGGGARKMRAVPRERANTARSRRGIAGRESNT